MSLKPIVKESLRERIYFFSLVYLAITIPFQHPWFPPTIGIITISLGWILSFNFNEKIRLALKNKPLLVILGLFLVSLVGMIHTSNTTEGWKDVEVKISLLLLPLALGLGKPMPSKRIQTIIKVFSYAVSIAVIILIFKAFGRYLHDGNNSHFFYGNFASFKMIPTHYFALYVNFALFSILRFTLEAYHSKKHSKSWFLLQVLLILVLVAALFLCSVRIQFIAFIVTSIFFLFWHFGKRYKPIKLILVSGAIILFLFSIAWAVPESRRRITETLDEYSAYRGREEVKQMNHRVFLWKYGWKVINTNFWIGTGTGAANDELYEYLKYEKARFWDGKADYTLAKKKYNLHNEFLQHFASSGIIGMLLCLGVFAVALLNLPIKLEFIGALFLLLTFISFNTESMLERQAGNLFFAFLYGVLFVSNKRTENS